MKTSFKFAAVALAGMLGLAGAAAANPVKIEYRSGTNAFIDTTVTPNLPNLSLSQNVAYVENGSPGTYGGPGGLFRLKMDGMNIEAFCVELRQTLTIPGYYDLQNAAYGVAKYTQTAINRLDALISNVWSTAWSDGTETSASRGNAFQLAVWEITKERDGALDLGAGDFKVTTSSPSTPQQNAIALATTWLGNISNGTWTGNGLTPFAFLTSPTAVNPGTNTFLQDLVVIGVAPVPLPAGIVLMGTAAIGMAALRRRRRTA